MLVGVSACWFVRLLVLLFAGCMFVGLRVLLVCMFVGVRVCCFSYLLDCGFVGLFSCLGLVGFSC